MKKFLLLLTLLMLCSCAEKPSEKTVFAMDTVMSISIYGDFTDEIIEIINDYERIFSPTRSDSVLSSINRGEDVHDDVFDNVLESATALSAATGGAFDPTLGNLIDVWSRGSVPSISDIDKALATSGADKINNGAKLNLSAIAKGALSDAIYQKLCENEIKSAILSLGGNVLAFGEKPDGAPWTVGLRNPKGDAESYLGTISVRDKFVVSSGDYERYFEQDGVRYHHILDPNTGYPARNDLHAVTVIAENGALADAYSTALFVMGCEQALDFWRESGEFEAVFVLDDKVIVTDGIENFNLTDEGYIYEVAHR